LIDVTCFKFWRHTQYPWNGWSWKRQIWPKSPVKTRDIHF